MAHKNPHRQIITRIPEPLYAELLAFNPSLVGPLGTVPYGAMQKYVLSLITQDLEKRKENFRASQISKNPSPGGNSSSEDSESTQAQPRASTAPRPLEPLAGET